MHTYMYVDDLNIFFSLDISTDLLTLTNAYISEIISFSHGVCIQNSRLRKTLMVLNAQIKERQIHL